MTASFAHPGLAEPRTKEEWRAYLTTPPPARPVMPPRATYQHLAESERLLLDDARQDYHSALVLVRTEQMKRLHHNMHRRMRTNACQAPGARRAVGGGGDRTRRMRASGCLAFPARNVRS